MIGKDEILRVSRAIAGRFEPDRILLFGSHARGLAGDESDVDLLVVMPYSGRTLDMTVRILDEIDAPFPLDLIVRTPSNVARRYIECDPIIREALDHGILLYERDG